APAGARAGVRAPRARARARGLRSALPRRLVPRGGEADRMKPPAAIAALGLTARPIRSAVPAWRAETEVARLRELCVSVAAKGGRLAALWGPREPPPPAGFPLH